MKLRAKCPLVAILCVTGLVSCQTPPRAGDHSSRFMESAMSESTFETDREEILGHIHGIFQAYLRQDREAIRRSHTADWTGFQGPSTQIERGIDAYMINADKSLNSLQGTGYELLDTEVQIYGDMAIVYYVARYDYRDADGNEGSIPLRSIDIYRRERDGWNQSGSHITVIPSDASWGESPQASTNRE